MQRRDIAVHGEHAIGDDQRMLMPLALLGEQRLDVLQVGMAERHHHRAGQPRAGIETGMRELIDQDQVAWAGERRDDAEIGEVARAEDAGRLGLLPARQPRLERGVERMVAGDQAGGAGADAVGAQRLDRRRLDDGMVGQVEVVVAAERQQLAAVAQRPDPGHAGGIDERAA